MALMMDLRPTKYEGEKKVWDCIKDNLPDEVICYYNREINGNEFDFCLLLEDFGLLVIEVKGWCDSHIMKVESPDRIFLSDGKMYGSPKKQAKSYRTALINKFNGAYNINPMILDMVCYPFMSESEYNAKGLRIVSEPHLTLFKEDINNPDCFCQKIVSYFQGRYAGDKDKIEGYVYDTIRHYFEPTYAVKPPMPTAVPYSALSVYTKSISVSEMNDIIESYFQGTKQIVFLSDFYDVEQISKKLSEAFSARHICINGGDLSFDVCNTPVEIKVRNNGISIFNFEARFVENLDCNESFIVYNGIADDKENDAICEIAQHTSFNYQQYCVEHADVAKDIEVRAGAGTGKTYSMVSRIAYLCHPSTNAGILDIPEELAMLTFTDDAATNMKTRIKGYYTNLFILTGNIKYLEFVNAVERMRISTIHSFAKDIIQKTSIAVGVGTNFATVSGTYERQKIFDRLFTKFLEKENRTDPLFFEECPITIDDLRKNLLKFAAKLYEKGCDIKQLSYDDFGSDNATVPFLKRMIEDVVVETEKEYSKQLLEDNCVSLSEYMIKLNLCIESEAFNTNLFGYKYIFIDEFQDTDDAQISAFLEMQKKLGFNFFIVGDLKQSIYRFRGATMDAFDKINSKSDNWLHYTLNLNYRSDARLLARYENIFDSLGNQDLLPYQRPRDELIGVKEWTEYSEEELLTNINYTSAEMKSGEFYERLFECIEIAKEKIRGRMHNEHLSDKERTIAILVRNNYQISDVLKKAKARNILVESDSSGDLYKLDSSLDLCKLTSALCNPYNITYLYDLIQSNYVYADMRLSSVVGKTEKEKLDVFISILDDFFTQTMHKSWLELVKSAHDEPVLKVLHLIFEKTMPWKSYNRDTDAQNYYRINYELVFEQLSNANKKNYLTLDSINQSLHICIQTGTESKSRELVSDFDDVKVVCLTVHKSKGLEYGTVILPFTTDKLGNRRKGSIEVTFIRGKVGYCLTGSDKNVPVVNEYYPSDSELQETRMEETRILYVAMTRAINSFIWFNNIGSSEDNWGQLLKELGTNGN